MSLNALGYSNVNLGSDVSLVMPESMKHQGLAYPALPNCKSRIVSVPCTNASSARSGQNLIVSLQNTESDKTLTLSEKKIQYSL